MTESRRGPLEGRDSPPADAPLSRRGFLGAASVLGASIVHWRAMPPGLVPVALLDQDPEGLPGKRGLTILNDRPINAETPAHLLDARITPAEHLFVRNNGNPPPAGSIDPKTWTLTIGGESATREVTFTVDELRMRFEVVTLQILIECGGNGRAEFNPPATGNQWTVGAVGCPEWTGVRLRDVLEHVGVKDDAVYIGYHGADTHLSGDPKKEPISRGVPIAKALEPETLLAFAMNGADMPWLNGHPLRLVVGGWPASTCGKWLTRIDVRDRVHDGAKMTGGSYRMPRYPVAPGTDVPDADMAIIESMPVKSVVTFPKSGITHALDAPLEVRGHAWAGDLAVAEVFVSTDFGQTWQPAELESPVNRFAWQHWQASVAFPQQGYYEIWARAVDTAGKSQPMVIPGWNPKGYLNNACHRIAVLVQPA